MTRFVFVLLLIALLLTLAACATPAATPTLDPYAPQALQGTMPAGGIYRFTPVPVSGTPEPDPMLVLDVTVVDGQTERLVRADVQVGDAPGQGQFVREGVSRFLCTSLSRPRVMSNGARVFVITSTTAV